MNSVYESLRALLRQKELEIKKLEKEIEALRIVLPIVAEAGTISPEAGKNGANPDAVKPYTATELQNVIAQAASSSSTGNIPAPDLTPKPRTTWP
jgi:hypothetical protein